MRFVVTGAGNPHGKAIVDALVAEDHQVRLFGCTAEVAAAWGETVQFHPGRLTTLGSIEPVLAEREVLIHAACLDAVVGKGKKAKVDHAVHIERGTLGCRYGAERELVEQFVHVAPPVGSKSIFQASQDKAMRTAQDTRKVDTHIVHAHIDPAATAAEVLRCVDSDQHFGRYPGRENDAVAA